jgi:hypothetical protein
MVIARATFGGSGGGIVRGFSFSTTGSSPDYLSCHLASRDLLAGACTPRSRKRDDAADDDDDARLRVLRRNARDEGGGDDDGDDARRRGPAVVSSWIARRG